MSFAAGRLLLQRRACPAVAGSTLTDRSGRGGAFKTSPSKKE